MKSVFTLFASVVLCLSLTGCKSSTSSDTLDPLLSLGLPADPGEAGMATIAGIDSDTDGVRDDIQRYIVATYPDNVIIQRVLRQLAKADQAFLVDADDEAKTFANERKTSAAIECLFSKKLSEDTTPIFRNFEAAFLNTKERILAQNKADHHLSGHVFSEINPDDYSKSCED